MPARLVFRDLRARSLRTFSEPSEGFCIKEFLPLQQLLRTRIDAR